MIYVVHTMRNASRYKFTEFSLAFRCFKSEMKNGQAALWYGVSGNWVRVYASEHYPEKLSEPYAPRSFFMK